MVHRRFNAKGLSLELPRQVAIDSELGRITRLQIMPTKRRPALGLMS